MPLYLLDTNTITDYRRGRPLVTGRVDARATGEVVTSAVSADEQLSGWINYLRQAKRPDQVERGYAKLVETVVFLATFPILPYDRRAIARFQTLVAGAGNIGRNDLRIAAVALEYGAVVVTANTVDFVRIPGLVIEDWTQP